MRKQSSAVLQFIAVTRTTAEHTPLFMSNYVTINMLDRLARVPGVGQVHDVRRAWTTPCASGSRWTG